MSKLLKISRRQFLGAVGAGAGVYLVPLGALAACGLARVEEMRPPTRRRQGYGGLHRAGDTKGGKIE